jgi:hypothetical protein
VVAVGVVVATAAVVLEAMTAEANQRPSHDFPHLHKASTENNAA